VADATDVQRHREILRQERERVLAESAAEIARMQSELRDAARRAGEREQELAVLKSRLERRLGKRRLSLRRGRPAEPDRSAELASLQRALLEREELLARQEETLKARERQLAERERQLIALAATPRGTAPGPARTRPPDAAPARTFAEGFKGLSDRPAEASGAPDGGAPSW
jgi:hypothetical protein